MKGLGFYENDFFIIKTDSDLIAESVKRILMTSKGERVGLPFFGVGLKRRLFEPGDILESEGIEKEINDQIEEYEPRVTSENISVDIEDNYMSVSISYKIKGEETEDPRIINFKFELEE